MEEEDITGDLHHHLTGGHHAVTGRHPPAEETEIVVVIEHRPAQDAPTVPAVIREQPGAMVTVIG